MKHILFNVYTEFQHCAISGYHNYGQDHSCIHPVKWSDSMANVSDVGYLERLALL